MLGSQADATATSFFPSKPLGAYGDGGALFTESEDRADAVSQPAHARRRQDALRSAAHRHERPPGFDPGRGAAGQADGVPRGTATPASASPRTYDQRLGNAVTTPARVPDSTSAWAIYAILLPRRGRARPRPGGAASAMGVPTAIYYPRPLHRQPAYRDQHDGAALPVSDDLAHASWRCRSTRT